VLADVALAFSADLAVLHSLGHMPPASWLGFASVRAPSAPTDGGSGGRVLRRTLRFMPARLPVLLMSATVAPDPAVPTLRVRDPQHRLQEYVRSLDFYLSQADTFESVIFAENSGVGLDEIQAVADRHGDSKRFHLLRVEPGVDPKEGRSAGEAHMVRLAMSTVPQLVDLPADQHVWKITGRYTVRNIRRLVATSPTTDFYINLRRYPDLWCDTYAYAFTRNGYYKYLEGATEAIIAGRGTGEQTMGAHVQSLVDAGEPIVARFKHEPRINGVRGRDLRPYQSPSLRMKYATRVVARRVAPRLWV
jgi:hypothetical protein